MEEKYEKLGQLIDKIDNFAHALKLALPAEMHVEQLRKSLPECVAELKRRDGLWNLYRQKSPKGSVLYVGCFAQSALIGILKSGQKQSS